MNVYSSYFIIVHSESQQFIVFSMGSAEYDNIHACNGRWPGEEIEKTVHK
jgi:hypothetical protein